MEHNENSRTLFTSKRVVGAHGPFQPVIVTDDPISAPDQEARADDGPATPTGKASIHWSDGANAAGLSRVFKTPRGYMSPFVDQNGSPIQRSLRREALSPMEDSKSIESVEPLAGNDVSPDYEKFSQEMRAENPYPNLQRRPLSQPRGPRPMHARTEINHSYSSPLSVSVTIDVEFKPKSHSASPKLQGKRSRDVMERTNTMAGRDAAREREIRDAHLRRVQLEEDEESSPSDDSDGDRTPRASELNKHLCVQEAVYDPMDLDSHVSEV
ncbi:hypothetical protein ACHAQH_009238 [Verticillium albo-atrum]